MFIYYYARLTTGRVLFFRRPTNTENPPAVDNRNIHHIYSFPIDTFTYFCAEDKKKIVRYCPRFLQFFRPSCTSETAPDTAPFVTSYIHIGNTTIIVLSYIYIICADETLFAAVFCVYLCCIVAVYNIIIIIIIYAS